MANSNPGNFKVGRERTGGLKRGSKRGSPLTRALVSQLTFKPPETGALKFDEATLIVRQLIKIAKYDNPDYYGNCVQAARELREIGYSEFGKPTQPIDTGFDLGEMLAGIASAVKASK